MTEHQPISSLGVGSEVHSIYIISTASLQQSRGGPYWRLELKDASGTLEAKIWSPASLSYPSLLTGQMIEIEGRTSLFRDQVQLSIDRLRVLNEEEASSQPMEYFMACSERPAADMLEDMEALCSKVLTHKPWYRFVHSVLNDKRIRQRLLQAPAARSVHHTYAGGLAEHLLSVAGLCMNMADHYSELDRQILLVGALLHDIGKIDEMNGLLATDYTDEGKFLGHIVQGLLLLEPFLQKAGIEPALAMHFKHLVASHHGFREFGAACEPSTPEAFALHFADNIDAKLAQCRAILPQSEEGTAWSPYITLLGRSLAKTVHTPEKDASPKEKSRTKQEDRQCSLL